MFRAHVLIIRISKLYYTASGIITPIGVMIRQKIGLYNLVIHDVYTRDFEETLMLHFLYYIFPLLQRLSGVADG